MSQAAEDSAGAVFYDDVDEEVTLALAKSQCSCATRFVPFSFFCA